PGSAAETASGGGAIPGESFAAPSILSGPGVGGSSPLGEIATAFADRSERAAAPTENPYLQSLLPPAPMETFVAAAPVAAVAVPPSAPVFTPAPESRAEI